MSNLEPEIAERLKGMAALFPAVEATDSIEIVMELRKRFAAIPVPPPRPEVQESTEHFETSDGKHLRMVVYKPGNVSEPLPVLVWYHGGGHTVGMPEQNAVMNREIALREKCVVVAPEYRLAPEHKYPVGVNDTWDALKHIAAKASTFGGDPTLGFAIGGESAGGVLAAVLQLRARDEKLSPPLTGALLSAGSYFNPDNIPAEFKDVYRSRYDELCKNSPMLSAKSAKAFYECHAADWTTADYRAALDPRNHKDLPRTYVQTCGADINRDDGIIYEHLLRQRGVETKLSVYEGGPHCFWFLFPDTVMGKKWREDTHSGIAWLLRVS
ncbi:AB hydrolase superfamily protein B1A11.02 [Pseudocercospora fuligena]|uniref:AB hydrolase superfamily protein B1A11.02 n=1 Tax=Pseudocercospora fuligena TaxID=685502 RepID=A0A8H6VMR2_9PEZI|nr:AB hydrolase superfamily protein B1A11.02 [Pseudocercospora fuligena]